MTPDTHSPRPSYGYDAPGVMIGLLLGGAAAVLTGVAAASVTAGWWRGLGALLIIAGAIPSFLGVLMVIYAFVGKARTRDHILQLARLCGDEALLDIGTGAGLLLVGAAQRLPRGTAIGIDLWSATDLSDNGRRTLGATRRPSRSRIASRC